ncbi:MAG: GNAT family N-acetyltransferase [Halioglobus sp.]|nr:GNAT family N-acetyltransferase [Halioglobus sp.]
MDSPPVIRDGAADDLDTLVDTLSDSFAEDPIFNWVFPDAALYPLFFRLVVRELYLPRGMIHMDDAGRAVALWLPPEERYELPPRLSLITFGVRLARAGGLRYLRRLRTQGAVYAKHLPREPHYYLQFLGCSYEHQGRGIGSAVLREGLRVCDGRDMPVYLESSNERNLPLYERHGFVVRDTAQVAKNGPNVWFMWREPQR